MAATKKSSKRSAGKKGPAAKRQSTKKKKGKAAAPRTTQLKRQARRGLKAARGGLDTVLQAGEKTWETLKSTTAQVVEGVKETLGGEPRSPSRRSNSR